jgi:glycosyltransferase involved in cell wall biosynthesis
MDLGPNALVFTGTMDYRPNVDAMLWFTEAVLPQVLAKVPDAHLYIVGKNPHPRLAHLHHVPGITLTGRVDSTVPYLHAASVYTAPLRMGSGTRLKLLEAMSAGCAIVSTTIAAAGLQADVKSSMVIADEPAALVDAIVALLGDGARRGTLGQAARQSVARRYDWPVIIPRLLHVYEGISLG